MNFQVLRTFILFLFLIHSELLLSATPLVTSVTPTSGPVAGGNLVTINGSGFTGTTVVAFGNIPAIFSVINDTTIQATAPVSSPGAIDVIITAPGGTSVANPPADFYTYQGNWFAYVPDFGSANVFPINTSTQIVGPPIVAQAGPNDVVFTPNGKIAISVNSSAGSISIIDVATQTVLNNVPVAGGFPILAITPDGKKATIVNYSSNSVTLVDLTTFTTTVISVGNAPTSIAIIPNGNFAYVTNSGSSSLTQINMLTLGTIPISTGGGSIPTFIQITPDGNTAVLSDDATNSVVIFDPITLTFGVRIFGFSLQGSNLFPEIAITPDGTTAWVTNTSSNTISSVIGLNTPSPTFGTSITVGGGPNGIAITPDGKQAYVSNATTNNESIVTFSNASVINIPVGITPTDPGITPDQAPVAYFTVNPLPAGQESTFDASTSLSPVGSIASYAWDFGDGSPITITTTPVITHSYFQGGIYDVDLTVTNTAGTSTTQNYTGQVMLNNGGPSAHVGQNVTIPGQSPSTFTGHQCKNKFATQIEYVNRLSWDASSNPNITSYLIYRNGILISTVSANGKLKFDDHDRIKNHADTYTLIAVDSQGNQSNPLTITIR